MSPKEKTPNFRFFAYFSLSRILKLLTSKIEKKIFLPKVSSLLSIHRKLFSHILKNKKYREESFQQSEKRTFLPIIRCKLEKYAIFNLNHKINTPEQYI